MDETTQQLIEKLKKALDEAPSKEKLEVLTLISDTLKKLNQAVKDSQNSK